MSATQPSQLAPVVIHLLKSILFREQHPDLWRDLLNLQAQVIDYVSVLGLALMLEEAEGYAYLRQRPENESADTDVTPIPKLVQRRPLSYPVSLLCVLLRKKLVEADAGGGEIRVVLSRDDIVNLTRVFLPERSNEARVVEQLDAHINKVVELGFLRKLPGHPPHYEVQRILKALVDADWLADLNEKLKVYREYAEKLER